MRRNGSEGELKMANKLSKKWVPLQLSVLSLNNYFYLRGGSERVFFEEMRLLEKNGHFIIPFSRNHPENFPNKFNKYFPDDLNLKKTSLKTVKEIIYSNETKNKLKYLLEKKPVHIAHAHNIYGRLTTSVLDVLYEYEVPTVLTLHDYKIICPNYQLFSKGKLCEACKPHKYYMALIKKCVHDNLAYSLIYSLESYFNFYTKRYIQKINKFIAVSKFIMNKFIEFGVPANKLIYIPNFIDSEKYTPNFSPGNYFLYFGRISKEKGLNTLIKAFEKLNSNSVRLVIAGTGPLLNFLVRRVEDAGIKNIQFTGYLHGNRLQEIIQQAKCIIVPSEWYENCPMSVLEALALGKPVIGADIGGISELIDSDQDGLLFKSGDVNDLSSKIESLARYPSSKLVQLGQHGRKKIKKKFSAEHHYNKLMELYRSLV